MTEEEERIFKNTSTEDFLKRPEPEEQEREREEERNEREFLKEHEKRVLKIQVVKAQTEADIERVRRLNEDFKTNVEINKKMASELEASLKTEDIKEIVKNDEFLNEVEKSSTRHQDFHSGSSKRREALQYRNFLHIISQKQAESIRFHLKKRFKLHSDEYREDVLVPETILRLYCRAHNLSRVEAEKKLLFTGMDVEMGSEEEAVQPSREEERKREKEEEKAEKQRKARQVNAKRRKQLAQEKEKPEEKGVFKFKFKDSDKKEHNKEKEGQIRRAMDKKQNSARKKAEEETRTQEKERAKQEIVAKKEQDKRAAEEEERIRAEKKAVEDNDGVGRLER